MSVRGLKISKLSCSLLPKISNDEVRCYTALAQHTYKEFAYARIYKRLLDVIPDLLAIESGGKSVVSGYMDLNLDILDKRPDKIIIALSHYYKHPSGDMIADPDMEVAVYPEREMAEAVAYQDSWGYRRVYNEDSTRVNVKAKRE